MAHLLGRAVAHFVDATELLDQASLRRAGRQSGRCGLALVVVAVTLMSSGCGCECDVGERTQDPVFITGIVLDRDGDRVSVEASDGSTHVVEVSGRAWALETGRSYRFPTFETDDGRLIAAMPGHCNCGLGITEADGDPIDTSLWGWFEDRLERFVTVAGLALASVVVVWGLARFVTRWWEERPLAR